MTHQGFAQVNNTGNAIAAGLVAGGAILALNNGAEIETLEWHAAQHVMVNFPEKELFQVRVAKKEGETWSLKNEITTIIFELWEFDWDGRVIEKSILLLLGSPGWISEYGIVYTKTRYQHFSGSEWLNIFSDFIELKSPVTVDRSDFTFPRCVRQITYDDGDSTHFLIGDTPYKQYHNRILPLALIDFQSQYNRVVYRNETVIPFFNWQTKTYQRGKNEDGFVVFAQGDKMGLLIPDWEDASLIKNSVFSKTLDFLMTTTRERENNLLRKRGQNVFFDLGGFTISGTVIQSYLDHQNKEKVLVEYMRENNKSSIVLDQESIKSTQD